MKLTTAVSRLDDRRSLLRGLDRVRHETDARGIMEGIDGLNQQALSLILGKAPDAFDLAKEDPRTVAKYGGGLGSSMLMARRLCEAGCGFVTVSLQGWDMHGNVKGGMNGRGPQVDRAVSAFIDDIHQRGLDRNILFVLTGEFGRTPRINKNAGRDHWGALSTLALAGGGLRVGQTVGESSSKAERPRSNRITPQALMATVFHVLGRWSSGPDAQRRQTDRSAGLGRAGRGSQITRPVAIRRLVQQETQPAARASLVEHTRAEGRRATEPRSVSVGALRFRAACHQKRGRNRSFSCECVPAPCTGDTACATASSPGRIS